MASLTEARAAIDQAFELVASFGVTVITIRPTEVKAGWALEIETVRPLHKDVDQPLEVEGVPLVIIDRGKPPPRLPYSPLRRRALLPS